MRRVDEPEAEPMKPTQEKSTTARSEMRQPLSLTEAAASWKDVYTVMMRNIPNKYTQTELREEFRLAGFEGTYDFIYLPMDPTTHANRGYAFINFSEPAHALRFRGTYEGCKLKSMRSKKVVSVSPAALQGFEANYRHYASAWISQTTDVEARPLFLRTPTPSEEANLKDVTCVEDSKKASNVFELQLSNLLGGSVGMPIVEPTQWQQSQCQAQMPLHRVDVSHQQSQLHLRQVQLQMQPSTICQRCDKPVYGGQSFCGFCGFRFTPKVGNPAPIMSTTPLVGIHSTTMQTCSNPFAGPRCGQEFHPMQTMHQQPRAPFMNGCEGVAFASQRMSLF